MLYRAFSALRTRAIDRKLARPAQAQEQVLKKILDQLRGTRLGSDLRLDAVNGIDAFRKRVPVTDYTFYRSYIRDVLNGEASVLFPGQPVWIGQTGGTTGEPKRLPLSKSLIRAYRQFNLDMALCYMADSGRYDVLSDKIFLVAANPEVERINDTPVGFITGIMARIAPAIVRRRYVPGLDTISNPDMREKIARITHEGYTNRSAIRTCAGLTTYLMAAWTNLMEYARSLEGREMRIGEIFPELAVAFHGGSTFDLYLGHMRSLSGEWVDHRNVYSANEGPVAFQLSGSSPGLVPAIDAVFLELLPADCPADDRPQPVLLHEIECGKRYFILLTTQGGLLRYKIGDVVEFLQKDPLLLRVHGKAEDQIDLSAEKMSADEAALALRQSAAKLGTNVVNFVVCPKLLASPSERIAHEWIVELADPSADAAPLADLLESSLSDTNHMYRELREENFALGRPQLTLVPRGTFQRYIEKELNYGQQKILHMHNDRSVADRLLAHD